MITHQPSSSSLAAAAGPKDDVIARFRRGAALTRTEKALVRTLLPEESRRAFPQLDARDGEEPLRWTPQLIRAVETKKAELGLQESIFDVHLLIQVLARGTRWRMLVADALVTMSVVVLMLAFSFSARWLNNSAWTVAAVQQDLAGRRFLVNRTMYDANISPLTRFNADYSYSDLDPVTLAPITHSPSSFFPCVTALQQQPSQCLNFSSIAAFADIRTTAEFQDWVTSTLSSSQIFSSQSSLVMLGAARLFQSRLQTCSSASATSTVNIPLTTPAGTCVPLLGQASLNITNLSSSALWGTYQTAEELASFPNPVAPLQTVSLGPPPQRASVFFNANLPQSGFALDLNRSSQTAALAEWAQLVQAGWINEQSAVARLSLNLLDSSNSLFVFATFFVEIYSTGTVVPVANIKSFQLPGSDSAQIGIRYVLCAWSLLLLLAHLSWAAYRLVHHKAPEKVLDGWLLLDVTTMTLLQAGTWSYIALALNPVVAQLDNPAVIARMAADNYTSYISMFETMTWTLSFEDFMVGICYVLLGLKLFRVAALYPRSASAYSIVALALEKFLAWGVLLVLAWLFFALGAAFMFGLNQAQFSTVGDAMMTVILYTSYSVSPPTLVIRGLELPISERTTMSILNSASTTSTAVVFSFLLWLGLLVVSVIWIVRNVLLGIVIWAFEIVSSENEVFDSERRDRDELFAHGPRLRLFWRRSWHHRELKRLHELLASNARLSSRGFATEDEMAAALAEVSDDPERLVSLLLPFKIKLERLNEAVAMLVDLEGAHEGHEEDDEDAPAVVVEGNDVLTALCFVLGPYVIHVARDVGEAVDALDREQRRTARRVVQEGEEPWRSGRGQSGIEHCVDEGVFKVHLTTSKGQYRFVGAFKDPKQAEAAYAQAQKDVSDVAVEDLSDEEEAASLTAGETGEKSWWARRWKFGWGQRRRPNRIVQEELTLNAKGEWSDDAGNVVQVKVANGVLPLARLQWLKVNKDEG